MNIQEEKDLLEFINHIIDLTNRDLSHPLPIHRSDIGLILEKKREALECAIDIIVKIIIYRHCS